MDFCFFIKNVGKNIGKKLSKNLSSKYSQKILDNTKQSLTDKLKIALKRGIHKIAGATGDLIGNKIADKITKLSRGSPQNNLESVESETKSIGFGKGIPRERHISPKEKQELIDDL